MPSEWRSRRRLKVRHSDSPVCHPGEDAFKAAEHAGKAVAESRDFAVDMKKASDDGKHRLSALEMSVSSILDTIRDSSKAMDDLKKAVTEANVNMTSLSLRVDALTDRVELAERERPKDSQELARLAAALSAQGPQHNGSFLRWSFDESESESARRARGVRLPER